MSQFGGTFTITATVPVRLIAAQTLVQEIFIEVIAAGTGSLRIMSGVPAGTTPAWGDSLTYAKVEIAPPSTTSPSTYSKISPGGYNSLDLSSYWVDGTNTGDTVRWSAHQR